MLPSSTDLHATARKCRSALMSGLAALGLKRAGEILAKDKSAISRWKSGEIALEIKLEDMALLVTECGYKLVPQSYKCVDQKTYESVWNLAREALKKPPELDWEESE